MKNRLGITNPAELAREEERISKQKAAALFQNQMLSGQKSGTLKTLMFIHKWLFDEIYDFAGEIRTVNLAKGNFRFAPVMYLEAALVNVERMPQSTFDEIVEHSPIRDIEIKHVLRNALTDRIDDRMVFMKGIDASYYYEGYNIYKTEEL